MAPKSHHEARNGRDGRAASRAAHAGNAAAMRGRADLAFAQGNAMLAQGKTADAVQKYIETLKIEPDFPEALCNLGSALSRLDRPGSVATSIECFQRAIALAPRYALAHNNLGAVFANVGRLNDALAEYRRAVELDGKYIEARCNLAGMLLQLGSPADAVAEYARAMRLDRSNSIAREALLNLANLAEIEGRIEDAEAICSELARVRPHDIAARVSRALIMPVVPESREQIERVRVRIRDSLTMLTREGIRLDDPYRQFGKTNFYLAYQGLNDRELQQTIAKFHLDACPELGWIAPHCLAPRKAAARLKLGIVCEYLDGHTIGKLYRGIVEELSRERFEIVLMRAHREADSATTQIDMLADRVVDFPRSLKEAREIVAAERCDVIFYPEIGMDELTYYLAFARLAPVQCVSWGHPVTTGIPAIDYFISGRAAEPDGADDHYSERLVRLTNSPVCYRRPPRPDHPLARERLALAPQATLYLCPQSLFKFHPDFAEALATILHNDRNAHLLLIRGRQPHWQELLEDRFARTIGDVAGRIVFYPPFLGEDFFRLLMTGDVMLDPFHFGGGNSTYEALAMGLPIVTLPGEFMRGRVTSACYERMGIGDLIASDAASYAGIAIRVANDHAWRAKLSEEIRQRCAVLYDDRNIVREIENFFITAYEAKRSNANALS